MKKTTKLTLLAFLFAFVSSAKAQTYCTVTGAPYASVQPGITNFQLNTINRTSSNSESGSSVMVTTGLSTTLVRGQSYSISLSHSEDATNFPGARNNIRIYIDYNQNFVLTDAGETAITVDNQNPGTTYTASFTVPMTATLGSTRLRATAKMGADAGHTVPTPCNSPADPIGYHGEIEDYTVTIVATTGIDENKLNLFNATVFPNPFSETAILKYELKEDINVAIEIYNVLGEKVASINKDKQSIGEHQFEIGSTVLPKAKGLYYVKIISGEVSQTIKLVYVN